MYSASPHFNYDGSRLLVGKWTDKAWTNFESCLAISVEDSSNDVKICGGFFSPDELTIKLSKAKQLSPLPSSVLFKASAVRYGAQQPSGSEPRSLSTRL